MLLVAAVAVAADQSGTTTDRQKVCYSKGKSGSRLKWTCQDPPAAAAPSRAKTQPDAGSARLVQYTEPAPEEAEGQSTTTDQPRPVGQWVGADSGGSASATDQRRPRGPATILPVPEPIARGPETMAGPPGALPDEPVLDYQPPAGASKTPSRVQTVTTPAGASGQGGIPKPLPFEGASGPKRLGLDDLCRSPKDLKRINELTTNIAPSEGDLPHDCSLGNDVFRPRSFAPITYAWTASGLCHKPLYFEDVQLERYGHMAGPWLQPLASCADFFVTIPILPYEMGLEPPNECIYTLGYYRPGSCAPYLLDPLPLSVRASLFEAGAWVGGAFVF